MNTATLQIERLGRDDPFVGIDSDWSRLAGANLMRSPTWAKAWWRNFGTNLRPYVLVVRNDEQHVVGILPLAAETTLLRGRRLILIGSGKACGDDMGLLACPEQMVDVARTIVDYLHSSTGEDAWDFLDLDGIQPSNPASYVLLQELRELKGATIEEKTGPSCWCVEINGTWETYLASLSKRMRKIIRELEKDYLGSGRAVLDVAVTLEQAKAKLKKTADFHQSRWKSRDVDGCFETSGFGEFVNELLTQWWADEKAYVATIRLDGRDVAGAFGFWCDGELCVYLVGMDIEVQECRPGWMLNIETLKQVLAAGKRRCNFLRGDEEYKSRLGALPTEQGRWLITSPRFVPQLRRSAIHKGIEVRDWFLK